MCTFRWAAGCRKYEYKQTIKVSSCSDDVEAIAAFLLAYRRHKREKNVCRHVPEWLKGRKGVSTTLLFPKLSIEDPATKTVDPPNREQCKQRRARLDKNDKFAFLRRVKIHPAGSKGAAGRLWQLSAAGNSAANCSVESPFTKRRNCSKPFN